VGTQRVGDMTDDLTNDALDENADDAADGDSDALSEEGFTEDGFSELGPDVVDPLDGQTTERIRLRVADDALVRGFIVEAAQLMDDLHCSDVRIYDVRGMSDITDYLVIGSGTSDRQISSVAKEVEVAGKKHDLYKFGADADGPSKWVVVDFVDFIVHLFEPETRAFYDLEMMWGDAPLMEWKREA